MISIAVTKPNMNLYVLAKPRLEGSFSAISVRCFDEVAKLREELVVRLSELQAIQPIPGLGRELDCREVSHLSPEAHRTRRTHSSMDCQHVALGPSVAVGSTEEQRNKGGRATREATKAPTTRDDWISRGSLRVATGACPPSSGPADGFASASRFELD